MLETNKGYLPNPLSKFIGRESELKKIKELLSDHRLVTLTGTGGSGKTRLSIKVAQNLRGDFKDEIWFIPFAPRSESSLVPQIVSSQIGIREAGQGDTIKDIINYLISKHSLLIFDNCEHLIEACAKLADRILQGCPNISILTTSREQLGIPGEMVWTVPFMPVPDPQPWRNPTSGGKALDTYRESDAIQLFLNRASLVSANFELTLENGAWIAEICRNLDGLPLGIELAAAHVNTLSIQQISERLDDRFNLLTKGSRTGPTRHQSLAAALDWSYELLSKPERRLLRNISVFSGGAALEAIEYVCRGNEEDKGSFLEDISSLVDKSLVVTNQISNRMRYSLLETIRQYASEKLKDTDDFIQIKNRHSEYFLRWAEQCNPLLDNDDQPVWLSQFEENHDNLRKAIYWSIEKNYTTKALRLAAACGKFWRFHGYTKEGRMHLSNVLALEKEKTNNLQRVNALLEAAHLAYMQSDYIFVEELAKEASDICSQLGENGKHKLAESFDILGETASETGNYDAMFVYLQKSLEIYRELNDSKGIGDILMQIGWASMRAGDLQKAIKHLRECQPVFQKLGNQRYLGFSYSGLGEAAIRLGEYEQAKSHLENGLNLAHQIEDRWLEAAVLGSLGWLALNQNNPSKTRTIIRESLALRRDLGDQGGIAWCLEKLSNAMFVEKRYEKAAEIFAAAAALRSPLNSVIDDADLPEYSRLIADLQSKLGNEAFDSAWAKGGSRPIEEIIELALTDSKETRKSEKAKYDGLTKREREVARQIALGKSNREIAKEMSVTLKTVETYVTRILKKLGLNSRVQIATWAMEKGLN